MLSMVKRAVPISVKVALRRHDLEWLAWHFGTDKVTHGYIPQYVRHFNALRARPIRLLEIGVGGHDQPDRGGNSLRMWKAYFPRASIYGLDLFDKSAVAEHRLPIFRGSQNDPDVLMRIAHQIGRLDIVIDDGSHVNAHMRTSVETLFPLLPAGAWYVLEDIATSYWPAFGGSFDLANPETAM